MSRCPYCDFDAATLAEEVAHMNAAHPDVVRGRLERAGFRWDDDAGRWIDVMSNDD